ncbi:hypothetical protein KEM56_006464 [Ascosphaera pollenicola]|nr:hypothetical protein KEM56_006464 [Ascosphaera pollenicola]
MSGSNLSVNALGTSHPNTSSGAGSGSTTVTQLGFRPYQLPPPPPPTKSLTVRLRERVSTTWSRLTGARQTNDEIELGPVPGPRSQSVDSHAAQGRVSNPPALSNEPIQEAPGPDDEPLSRYAQERREAAVSRRQVLHATPIVVEISTAIDFSSDAATFVVPLRDQLASVLGRHPRAIYLSIEQPKVVLYDHARETYLAKVTALEGTLRVDNRRLIAIQRVLCDAFRVHPGNGFLQFNYVHAHDLAVGSRTMLEHISNRLNNTSYRQPTVVPSTDDLCMFPTVNITASGVGQGGADGSHPPPLRFYGPGPSNTGQGDLMYEDGAFTRPVRGNPLVRRQQSPTTEREASPEPSETDREAPGTARSDRESSGDEAPATRVPSTPSRPMTTRSEYENLTSSQIILHEQRRQERYDREIERALGRYDPPPMPTENEDDAIEEVRSQSENPDDVIEVVRDESQSQALSSAYSRESGGAGHVREESEASNPDTVNVFSTYLERGHRYPEPEVKDDKPESKVAKAIRRTTRKLSWKRGRSKTEGAVPDAESVPPVPPIHPIDRLLALPATPSHAVIRGRTDTENPVSRLTRRFRKRESKDVLPSNAPGHSTTAGVESSGTTEPAETTEPEPYNKADRIMYA